MTYLGEEPDEPKKKEGKVFDHGTKTRAGFFGLLRSDMRRRWMYSKVRAAVLKEASVSTKTTLCSECQQIVLKTVVKTNKDGTLFIKKGWHPPLLIKPFTTRRSNVDVDHIVPAGTLRCYEDINGFYERLWCPIEGLRVLCKPCHHEITHAKKS